ncbi:galectin-9-like isoform X1 [Spodoptera litura]|uniref:Galectin n=1 Tax=Spodoptera litura TaxID=69820 RepID=A0A9J7IL14_SPOLT|nr:galectin-9-like isoform X1 [Spodoptera litura]XP_022819086.1 galectin-9-like isoform X1 [Spodoptera litura]
MAAITNPRVPFTNSISGGMFPGRKMVVKGGIPPGSNGFSLNLVCGSDEIAFHFNPRFGEQRIVRNSLLSGNWGAQETSGGMPLIKGEPFEAQFECQEDCIRVELNGKHFCNYTHRTPYHKITHVKGDGDVLINQITFEGK